MEIQWSRNKIQDSIEKRKEKKEYKLMGQKKEK
jgi:hypothetical protein